MSTRDKVRKLAHEAIEKGEPTAWFERLYRDAKRQTREVPWADLVPNPALLEWMHTSSFDPRGKRALVIGCGLGDDAEYLAGYEMKVVAFDLSETAIAWCKERHKKTTVSYEVADLLDPPGRWYESFDLVLEAYTIQSLAPESDERARAIKVVRTLVAEGGILVVVARLAKETPRRGEGPPWALVRSEIDAIGKGLRVEAYETFADREKVARARAVFRRGRG